VIAMIDEELLQPNPDFLEVQEMITDFHGLKRITGERRDSYASLVRSGVAPNRLPSEFQRSLDLVLGATKVSEAETEYGRGHLRSVDARNRFVDWYQGEVQELGIGNVPYDVMLGKAEEIVTSLGIYEDRGSLLVPGVLTDVVTKRMETKGEFYGGAVNWEIQLPDIYAARENLSSIVRNAKNPKAAAAEYRSQYQDLIDWEGVVQREVNADIIAKRRKAARERK